MLNHELAMLQVRLTAMLQVRLAELEDAVDVLVMIELPRDFGGKPEASNNRANSWRCAVIARLRHKVTAAGGDLGAPGPTGVWSTRVRSHPSVSGRDVQVAPARVLGLDQVQMPSSLPVPDEIPRGRDIYARDSILPMDGLAHLSLPLCNALLLHLQVAARKPVSNAIAFPGSWLEAHRHALKSLLFWKGGPSHHGQCGVARLLRCRLHSRPARLGSTFARGPRPSPAG